MPFWEAIVVENVGEAGGENTSESLVEQRPGGMFARGSAAEVVPRQEDRGLLIARLVQEKFRILGSVFSSPPIANNPSEDRCA